MATKKSLAFQTVKVRAMVVNQRSGTGRLLEPLLPDGSLEEIRSTHFNKFPDNTLVECVFRTKPDGSFQLVTVTLIDPDARYQVFVSGLTTEEIDELKNFLYTQFNGARLATVTRLMKNLSTATTEEVLPITPDSYYDEAIRMRQQLSSLLPEVSFQTFRVNERTSTTEETSVASDVPRLEVPNEWINGHWLSGEERLVFGVLKNLFDTGEQVNLLLRGPSGYGKTSKIKALATYLNCDYVYTDCSTILDTESWFGYQEAREGSTWFIPTEFTEAIRRGRVVVCLDEANRVEPQLANSLFPILDFRRRTRVHNEDIEVGPSVVFAMTVNLGVKYAGTHVTDAAFMNRVDLGINVGPMPLDTERDLLANQFPNLARSHVVSVLALTTELRKVADKQVLDIDVSTRTSLRLAKMMAHGMLLDQAARAVIMSLAEPEDQKVLQDTINMVLRSASTRP